MRNDGSLLPSTLLWQHGWEVRIVYRIPTVRAVHILSTDTGSPGGSVAKQVTVCFKSLPDAPFSQTQMRNRRGPLNFLEKGNIGMTVEWTPSPLTVKTEIDLLVEAAAFTWGLHVWSVKTITSSVCLQIIINLFTKKKNSGKLILYRSCHKRARRSSYRSASNDIHTVLKRMLTHTLRFTQIHNSNIRQFSFLVFFGMSVICT